MTTKLSVKAFFNDMLKNKDTGESIYIRIGYNKKSTKIPYSKIHFDIESEESLRKTKIGDNLDFYEIVAHENISNILNFLSLYGKADIIHLPNAVNGFNDTVYNIGAEIMRDKMTEYIIKISALDIEDDEFNIDNNELTELFREIKIWGLFVSSFYDTRLFVYDFIFPEQSIYLSDALNAFYKSFMQNAERLIDVNSYNEHTINNDLYKKKYKNILSSIDSALRRHVLSSK